MLRTATDLGVATVAIAPPDDLDSQHVRLADEHVVLEGAGPAAYLDIEQVLAAAKATGANAVHPGYGFLAENPDLAAACAEAGIVFVGPTPESLLLFGDKSAARSHAESCAVPLLAGTSGPTSLDEAQTFLASLPGGSGVMVKAVAGGGGRGMRGAVNADELAQAFERCASEAQNAFGSSDLYVEEMLGAARHVEVQVVGDGTGRVAVLGDRECSVQRSRQKLLEMAPAPNLNEETRARLHRYAADLAAACDYRSLATMEFLVAGAGPDATVVFLEGNARIQVEHTVTEEIFGVDLVAVQLAIATGNLAVLDSLGADSRGVAVQARVLSEQVGPDGAFVPTGGSITRFSPPAGPGIRVDTHMAAGMTTNPRYDSLLAKVVAWVPEADHGAALRRLGRALDEFTIEGADTTLGLSRVLVAEPAVADGSATTTWLEANLEVLAAKVEAEPAVVATSTDAAVVAPMQGTVLAVDVAVGDEVAPGQQVAVMEAMKMEHVVVASLSPAR